MSARGMEALLTACMVNPGRLELLLQRAPSVYEEFDMTLAEAQMLLGIEASSFEEYACHAHMLFYGEDLCGETDVPLTLNRASSDRSTRFEQTK